MEKTLDEKVAELTVELAQVKERLDKCEQKITKHQTAIERDIPEMIKKHPGHLV
jgi:chromosome segregation ATPase